LGLVFGPYIFGPCSVSLGLEVHK